MSDHLLRTFISVTVPNEIISLQDMLKTTVDFNGKNLRWSKPGQIHLTLKFIGHTPPDSLETINKELENIVRRHEWMELSVQGTGCFPIPQRPRILWLGLDGQLKRLEHFINDINESLETIGFPREEKDFIPHITIGRVKYPPKTTPDISTFLNVNFNPIPMSITRIRFMSSELFSGGPIYSILGTHFLTTKTD